MLYKSLIRPILFSIDPELAHEASLKALSLIQGFLPFSKIPFKKHEVEVAGIKFPSKIGLAAGMDKACVAPLAWQSLGFGFVEVGTITYHSQLGNSKPRLFRLAKQESLINRLGFNGPGAEVVAERLKKLKQSNKLKIPMGANIGKSRIVNSEDKEAVINDYLNTLDKVQAYADYIAINVSSPNTPGLRDWQSAQQLISLLQPIKNKSLKPIFLKISPDLDEASLNQILEVANNLKIDGIIATNTTISRKNCPEWSIAEAGGLSGALLKEKSLNILKQLIKNKSDKLAIISVGGIHSADDIKQRLDLGADLVQIYTALVYEGPWWVSKATRDTQEGIISS
jgi:dihydroorotate dehydrogenase